MVLVDFHQLKVVIDMQVDGRNFLVQFSIFDRQISSVIL